MIRRLVEAHYFRNRDHSTAARVRFRLQELRTPQLLIDVAQETSRCEELEERRHARLRA